MSLHIEILTRICNTFSYYKLRRFFILFYSLFKGTLKIHYNFTTFPNYTRILKFHYNFCCVPSFNDFFLTIERTEKCALMRELKNLTWPYLSCRITLLLGPPGCGKTILLKDLPGNLNQPLKVSHSQ